LNKRRGDVSSLAVFIEDIETRMCEEPMKDAGNSCLFVVLCASSNGFAADDEFAKTSPSTATLTRLSAP
jgi:hypothetical protein